MKYYYLTILICILTFPGYGQDYLDNHIIVKLNKNQDFSNFGRSAVFNEKIIDFQQKFPALSNSRAVDEHGMSRIFDLTVSEDHLLNDVISELKNTGIFEYVEPVYIDYLHEDIQANVPNDPGLSQQYHHDLIRTFSAWPRSKGDGIIIAIIDSGVELNHEDLRNQIFINEADPINGIDDDGDGFIDNYFGWDFVGFSIDELNRMSDWSKAGNNDPNATLSDHGTHVAGIAAAQANNNIGIAGIAPEAKIMVLKCGEDKGDYPNAIVRGYDAIVYAAERGADVINCSWGGRNFSSFAQNVIDYARSLGSIIVASAGNSSRDEANYPAAYRGVISVANTNSADIKSNSSTFHSSVRISAPGESIYSTVFNNGYGFKSGTSMAAPIVSGAAAIFKNSLLNLTSAQLESIIVNSVDDIYSRNPSFRGKLGIGRINLEKGSTGEVPGFDLNAFFRGSTGTVINQGESFELDGEIINFLTGVQNVEIEINSSSPLVTLTNNKFTVDNFFSNRSVSFREIGTRGNVADITPDNLDVLFNVRVANQDFSLQYFLPHTFNQTLIDFTRNNLASSITANGRIGYSNPQAQNPVGSGLIYEDENYLSAHGILMADIKTDHLLDNIFNDRFTINNDFNIVKRFNEEVLKNRYSYELGGSFADNFVEPARRMNIATQYNLLVNSFEPHQNYFVIEYVVENKNATDYEEFSFGKFFAIQNPGGGTVSNFWDEDGKSLILSFANRRFTGAVQLLSKHTSGTTPISNNFTFSKNAKVDALTGNNHIEDQENFIGNRFIFSTDPFVLEAGKKDTIAFAIHMAPNEELLRNSLQYADEYYNKTLKIPAFTIDTLKVCGESEISFDDFGQGILNWYSNFDDQEPFYTGSGLQINDIRENRSVFVTRSESEIESIKKRVELILTPQSQLNISSSQVTLCDGDSVLLSFNFDYDQIIWNDNFGESARYIKDAGSYSATIFLDDCQVVSNVVDVVIQTLPPAPVLAQNNFELCYSSELTIVLDENVLYRLMNPLGQVSFFQNQIELTGAVSESGQYIIQAFDDASCLSEAANLTLDIIGEKPVLVIDNGRLVASQISGATYSWFFNGNLVDQGTNRFTTDVIGSGVYSVEVQLDNCTIPSEPFELVISSVDERIKNPLILYPNPVSETLFIHHSFKGNEKIQILDTSGRIYYQKVVQNNNSDIELNLNFLKKGLYIVRIISFDAETLSEKIMKTH